MTCPDRDTLLAHLSGEAGTAIGDHVATCSQCEQQLATLRAELANLDVSVETLAAETPTTLETRLRFGMRGGATTLRRDGGRRAGLGGWLGRHRVLWIGTMATAAAVIMAILVAGPAPAVSAAQILERSSTALFAPLADAQRIVYRVHYEGPNPGMLPEGATDLRLEELWDRDQPGSFKLTLRTLDGTLVRGFVQSATERRVVAMTPAGIFDLRFPLTEPGPSHDVLELQRQRIAESMLRTLLRAADPQRLTHVERDGRHEIELGPQAATVTGMFELDAARFVVETDSYRLAEASVEGRILGERFRIDAEVETIESLPTGHLTAADFDLDAPAGAIVLEGDSSQYAMADVIHLLLREAARNNRPVAAQ